MIILSESHLVIILLESSGDYIVRESFDDYNWSHLVIILSENHLAIILLESSGDYMVRES